MGFLDQLVVLLLIFWKMFIQFYIAALPFYIPTDSIQGLWFLHNLPSAYFFSLSLVKLFQFYILSRIFISNEEFYLVHISLKTLHFTFWQCKLTSTVPGIQWNSQQMAFLLSLFLSWKNTSFVIRCFLRNKMSLMWIIIEQVIIVAEQNYVYFNSNLILITTP